MKFSFHMWNFHLWKYIICGNFSIHIFHMWNFFHIWNLMWNLLWMLSHSCFSHSSWGIYIYISFLMGNILSNIPWSESISDKYANYCVIALYRICFITSWFCWENIQYCSKLVELRGVRRNSRGYQTSFCMWGRWCHF